MRTLTRIIQKATRLWLLTVLLGSRVVHAALADDDSGVSWSHMSGEDNPGTFSANSSPVPPAGALNRLLPANSYPWAASGWTGYQAILNHLGQPAATSLTGLGLVPPATLTAQAGTGAVWNTYFQGVSPAALDAVIEANELTLHHIWPEEERRRGYAGFIHRFPEPVTIALSCAGVLGILLLLKPRRVLPRFQPSATTTNTTK